MDPAGTRLHDTLHYEFHRDRLSLETSEAGISSFLIVSGEQREQILDEFIWSWESLRLEDASRDR